MALLVLSLGFGGSGQCKSGDELRHKAVHIAYRLDSELGEIDAAQRHLMVARLLLGLESREFSPAAALDELWLEWETRIEALEDVIGDGGLPVWHQPFMPDLVDALSESVLPGQEPLVWEDLLWTSGLAATALVAVTGPVHSDPLGSAYYPGLLAWARSHAPDIWYRLLQAVGKTPEWGALITPLVDPWLALPLIAPLADWKNLDDRSSAPLAALLRSSEMDPLQLIDAEIDALFEMSLLVDRYRRPVLLGASYRRFLSAEHDPDAKALVSLARAVHRLDRGGYADFVGALYGLVLQQTIAEGEPEFGAGLLNRLDRLDGLLLPFLNRVDPRLINVYQQLRRLLREPVQDGEDRRQRLMLLASLESALGLDVAALDRYLDQPSRERLNNELIVCVGLTRYNGIRPPEPITREQYRGCVDALASWALTEASSPELSGRPEGPFAAENLARETQLSTWQRINYWLGFVKSNLASSCGAPQSQLSNPIEWAIAARGMAWFMDRWPQLADGYALDQLAAVWRAGRETLLELANLRRCVAPGQPLLGAIDAYRGNLAALQSALDLATAAFRAENLVAGADVDFGGAPDQTTRYRPDKPVGPCGNQSWCDVGKTLEASKALYALFPDPYLVADQTGLGKVEICYSDVTWVQRRAEVPRYGNEAMASYFGRLSFVLKGRFSTLEEPIFEMRLVSPDEYEYLFGANRPEVLNDPCPRHLVNTQVHTEMPERALELVPRRLTYMTADRTHPERVVESHWASGQEWRDWFVTGQGVEVLRQRDAEPIVASVEAHLKRLNGTWNQTLYRHMLAAGQISTDGTQRPLTEAMQLLQTSKLVLAALGKLLAPRALEFDPDLRATIFGDEGLFDRGAVLRLQQEGVAVNRLGEIAERRLNAASRQWRLASLQVSGRPLREAEPLLVGNLLKIEAALQRLRRLSPAAEPTPGNDQ